MNYTLVNFCEFNESAAKSYSVIHNVPLSKNLGDITKVDETKLNSFNMICGGSPCQDFSLVGKQAGGDKDSGTRSSLMYETIRIVNDVKPKIIIWENVKNVLSKKHKHNFDTYVESLDELGYNSYYQVLNAKDYGIPQNRERIFVVSIRKDIDKNDFKFPEPFELKLRLKDVLDDKVDEKYYIQSKRMDIIQKNLGDVFKDNFIIGSSQKNAFVGNDTICPSLTTAMGSGGGQTPMIKTIDIPQVVKVRKYPVDCKLLCEYLRKHKANSSLSNKEIAKIMEVPLTMVEHWFRQDSYFAIPDAELWLQLKSVLGIMTNEFDDAIMTFEEREGVYEKSERHYLDDGIAPTITSASTNEKVIVKENVWTETQEKMITDDGNIKRYIHSDFIDKFEVGQSADISFPNGYNKANRVHNVMPALNNTTTKSSFVYKECQSPLKIRKLTSKECFRLMGFDDEDFERAAKVVSDTQLYKQAGNSIVVNVLEAIFNELKVYLRE